jgi:hypothetical protein
VAPGWRRRPRPGRSRSRPGVAAAVGRAPADQDVIDQAAARLRHETAQDQYRGLHDPQVAFGLCALLDELSRHLRDVDDALRRRVVGLCRELLSGP